MRQLALELDLHDICVNAVRSGVTDTAALRKIPGNAEIGRRDLGQNPHGRLTTPEDVARVIGLLSGPEAGWISGTVIGVDGGEDITG